MVCGAAEPSLRILGEMQTKFIHSVNNSSQKRAEVVLQEGFVVVWVIETVIQTQDFINKAFPSSFAELKAVPQQLSDHHKIFGVYFRVVNLAAHQFHVQAEFYW